MFLGRVGLRQGENNNFFLKQIENSLQLKGVRTTRVGYAGGKIPDPTYKSIGDHTG